MDKQTFTNFINKATNEEKEEVLTEVVKLANEDIEKMIKNRPWRERLGGLDFNPAYKKQVIKLVEKTLQEQREEVVEIIKRDKGYIESLSQENDIEIDIVSRDRMKNNLDTLLKQLKK